MTPIVGGGTYDVARAACDLAITTGGYHKIGHRVADLGLPTVIVQEGGYYLPWLGVNVREWLRGLLRLPPDPARPPGRCVKQLSADHEWSPRRTGYWSRKVNDAIYRGQGYRPPFR